MTSRGFIVGKNGILKLPVAFFLGKEEAAHWRDTANIWYGPDHPLTPLTIWPGDVLFNPFPFPSPTASRDEIFENIDKD